MAAQIINGHRFNMEQTNLNRTLLENYDKMLERVAKLETALQM